MRARLMGLLLVLCGLAYTEPPATGAEPAEAPTSRPQPRLTLVLSGGGARGAAHIGVLKVLEEMRVPVDLIVGTSMGSIIGGLYAAGWSPGEIENLLEGTNFTGVLIDRAARDDKSFRRKQDDVEFLIPLKLRFKDWKPTIPPAALGGQRLELFLRTLEIESTDERNFDDFPVRYRAVAADLVTGEAVVLDKGSLAAAMRASMSVAGAFAPEVIDGRPLVDGGAAANLPVGIAQDLGAGAIIAVDITSPLNTEKELGSLFSVLDQLSSFLTVGNRVEDIKRLRPGDLLIRPELGDIAFSDFKRASEAVAIGEAAARAVADRLREFAVGEAEYAAFQARHHRRPLSEVVPDDVRLENTSWVADEVVRRRIHVPVGQPLDPDALRSDILRLHALDYFGTIRQSFDRIDGRRTLTLRTPLKPYGRNSLQFGVNFRDDFHSNAGYGLAVRHQLLAANRRGGEWQNIGQIGDTSLLSTEFYQPLDFGMTWFVDPGGEVRKESRSFFVDGEPVSEYRVSNNEARIDAGRVIGSWGEARAGVFYSNSSAQLRIGTPQFPDADEKDGGVRLRFRVDTRDDVVFPQRGLEIDAGFVESMESFGATHDHRTASLQAADALSFGRNTLVPGVEVGTLLQGPATPATLFDLGGLLRLSGLGDREIVGTRYGLATLVYYRELAGFNLGTLGPKLYAGASLETGNTYFEGDPVSLDSLRFSGSVFAGARTPLGPCYLGYGMAEGGRHRIYLNIGTRF
jgi:NTE family protein